MFCEKCGKEISENETICSNCGNNVETIDTPQEVEKKELGILSILGFILVLVPGITSLILYIFFGINLSVLISLLLTIPKAVGCIFAGISLVIYKKNTYKIIAIITLVLYFTLPF